MTVDFGFAADFSFNFNVNAGETFIEFDEIICGVEVAELANNLIAREAREESGSRRLMTQIAEHNRDVDAFAAAEYLLISHAIYRARREFVEPNNVINRGIKSYGVNHLKFPPCKIDRNFSVKIIQHEFSHFKAADCDICHKKAGRFF